MEQEGQAPAAAALIQGAKEARGIRRTAHWTVLAGAAAASRATRDFVFVGKSRLLASTTQVYRSTVGIMFCGRNEQPSSPASGLIADPTPRLGIEVRKTESRSATHGAVAQPAAALLWTQQTVLRKANAKSAVQGAAQPRLAIGMPFREQHTKAWTRRKTEDLRASTRKECDQGQHLVEEPAEEQAIRDLQANESSVRKPGEDPKCKRKIQRRQVSHLESIMATICFFALLCVGGTMAQMEEDEDAEDSCPISDGLLAGLLIGGFCMSYWIGWTLSSMNKSRWTYKWAVSEQLLILMTFLLSIAVALAAPFVKESCTGGRDYTALVLGIFDLFPRVISHAGKMLKMWHGKHVLSMVHGALNRYLPLHPEELEEMVDGEDMVRQVDRHQSKKFANERGEVLRTWDVTKFQDLRLTRWGVEPNWNKKKVIVSIAALLENTLHYTDLLDGTVDRWMSETGNDMYEKFLCTLAVSLLHIKEKLFGRTAKSSRRWNEFFEKSGKKDSTAGEGNRVENITKRMVTYSISWLSRIKEMNEFKQIVDMDGRTSLGEQSSLMLLGDCVPMMRFMMNIISVHTFASEQKLQEGKRTKELSIREAVRAAALQAAKVCKKRHLDGNGAVKSFLDNAVCVTELAHRWIVAIRLCVLAQEEIRVRMQKEIRVEMQKEIRVRMQEETRQKNMREESVRLVACLIRCGLQIFNDDVGYPEAIGKIHEDTVKELASSAIAAIELYET